MAAVHAHATWAGELGSAHVRLASAPSNAVGRGREVDRDPPLYPLRPQYFSERLRLEQNSIAQEVHYNVVKAKQVRKPTQPLDAAPQTTHL